MCDSCAEPLVMELEKMVLLEELSEEVIREEILAGLSAEGATRPLNAAEQRAKVKFGQIAALMAGATSAAVGVVTPLWNTVINTIITELLGDGDTVTPADAARAMARLNIAQPPEVQQAVADAANELQGILVEAANDSAALVAAEAGRQGINIEGWQPPAMNSAGLILPAAVVAMQPWSRITGRLQTVLLDPAKLTDDVFSRSLIESTLADISIKGTLDLAKQSIHRAHGEGRYSAAAEFEPSEIFASEILDRNTCDACGIVDGKQYADMDEARAEYPYAGYVQCFGDFRCRGTLVFLYREYGPLKPPEPLPPIDE